MIKELALVTRILYTIVFVLIGELIVFGVNHLDLGAFGISFLLVVGFSFLWQYYVLHFALRTMTKKQRTVMLIVWLIGSAAIMTWGIDMLASLDWSLDEQTLLRDFALKTSLYLLGAGMYIGGACTRRAYARHDAL